MYKIRSDSDDVQTTEYGKWNLELGLVIFQETIWKRRSDLQGNTIR